MQPRAGSSGRGIGVDESLHEQGTGPDDRSSHRGCWLILGGLFLLGAAILSFIWVALENSRGHLARNVVETTVFISAALAIGGVALIAGAVLSWVIRDGGAH